MKFRRPAPGNLRDLARRQPAAASAYIDQHPEEWGGLVDGEPADAADVLEAIEEGAAAELLGDLKPEDAGGVLNEMRPERAASVVENFDPMTAAALIGHMTVDQAAGLVWRWKRTSEPRYSGRSTATWQLNWH